MIDVEISDFIQSKGTPKIKIRNNTYRDWPLREEEQIVNGVQILEGTGAKVCQSAGWSCAHVQEMETSEDDEDLKPY